MSLKIATIAATSNGGAGKAAFRLFCGLAALPDTEMTFVKIKGEKENIPEGYNIVEVEKKKLRLKRKFISN